ncbi:hypothetical protein CLV46_3027 [Diaminobutyricimonas aerilata]|uniref:DUF7882 domain-containing protein n=1 Tax=Diaminobutyricimonas aerilata TaxID=1162967 RepID=A0A2M9CNE8_9MICO|nr:ATP-dependent DNA ligase [Diaminobutyricimonas aerilata]PJJ73435.1 hypothetical protein CLV46_3027 [Diaminobutyricimonas aerilata]
MGVLLYGDRPQRIEIEDRTLAHLQVVIGSKLRRRESFFFTFTEGRGETRASVWISPAVPIRFKYFGTRPPTLNREWLERLSASANTPGGLVLLEEQTD